MAARQPAAFGWSFSDDLRDACRLGWIDQETPRLAGASQSTSAPPVLSTARRAWQESLMLLKFALRDLVIVAVATSAWWLFSPLTAASGPLGDALGVVIGVLLGMAAVQLHEWGHLLGALASGSKMQISSSLKAVFIYSFDSRANSKKQFAAMSVPGLVVTVLLVWVAYARLPDGELATHVARGLVVLLVFLGVVLELPLLAVGLLTDRLPPVETLPREPRPAPGIVAAEPPPLAS